MEQDNRFEGCAPCVAVLTVMLLLLLLCCSCRTRYITETEYKEVPVVMHDTLRSHDTLKTIAWRIDTTIVKDSVFFAVKGDTIIKERYSTKLQLKLVHDTILASNSNERVSEKPVVITKTRTKTVTKEVNRLYWWQWLLMTIGVVAILYVGGKMIKKCRKLSR